MTDDITQPPPAWSDEAKRYWPRLSRHVREQIFADIAAAWAKTAANLGMSVEELDRHEARAREYGDENLGTSLARYVGFEDKLRRDPAAGIMAVTKDIARCTGVPEEHFKQWVGQMFADLARECLAVPPGSHRQH